MKFCEVKRNLAVAGILVAGLCMVATASFAAPKVKKMAKPKIPASIILENKRASELTNFSVYNSGDSDIAISSIAKPLDSGKKLNLSLKGLKSCTVTLSGTFADGSDASGDVDVCVEKQIRLVD